MVVRATSVGLISTIPIVGPVLGELVGAFIPDVRFRRVERLAEELKEKVTQVSDRLDGEYVRREEFTVLFEDAFVRATQARNDQKTAAFAAFMAHSMTTDRPSLADRERYLDILDELRPVHLQILAVLAAGSGPEPASPPFTVSQAASTALSAVLARVDGADWQDLADLERRGLTRPMAESSLLIATNVRNTLLPLGLAFVEFIAAEAPAASKSHNARRRGRRTNARAATPETATGPSTEHVAVAPRLGVLRELRDLNREQARTSAILELDLNGVADRLSLSPTVVQDALVDLLADGSAEPFGATFGRPAEEGSCRITRAGMQELARLEAGDFTSPSPPGDQSAPGGRAPTPSTQPSIRLDLRYHGDSRKLELANNGTESVFDVALEFPSDAAPLVIQGGLPINEIPAGRSVHVIAIRTLGPGLDHFNVHLRGRTADNQQVEQDAFVDLLG